MTGEREGAMGKISKYENIVLYVLKNYEGARSDDKLLYLWVLREERLNTVLPLENYLLGRCHNYPNYETITRCRRKLQEKYPELRPAKSEQMRREEAEIDFRRYARGEE